MDRKASKQQISDRYADLRRSQATEVNLFRQLLVLEYEDVKEQMVKAHVSELPALQAKAAAYDSMHRNLMAPTASGQEER